MGLTAAGEEGGFLPLVGEMAKRIRSADWSSTPLGRLADWPQPLRTLVALMLEAKQPMFLGWGEELTWLYNDAFTPILGQKHPAALGQPTRVLWAEAKAILDPLFDRVLSGEAVHAQGFTVPLDRRGVLEDAVFDFSYTPARGSHGQVCGLFGVCIEITERARAQQQLEQQALRQRRQFEQAPGFVIIMTGPQHVVEFVNDTHRRVFASADWIGKPIREAFPGLTGQGYFELLDKVYETGRSHNAERAEVRFQRTPSEPAASLYLSFIYAPILDDRGSVGGIFCDGFDVTAVVDSERVLQASGQRQHLLAELSEIVRQIDDPAEVSYASAALLGRALAVSRAGYGTIDKSRETILIERDWNAPGIKSLAGTLQFRDYGSYIDELGRGETVVISDAYTDPRTSGGGDALKAISAQALVNMPVTERGDLVALLYLNHAEARVWSADELALIREVAERTRSAVERRRAEEELRVLAASLERQVAERTAELASTQDALRHAQKMEAMGQLTGGLAHDFNNHLGVITMSLEVQERMLSLNRVEDARKSIDRSRRAAKAAAALTQRLLAFGRRQSLTPAATDVNRLVGGMGELIRRTVGPAIEVEVVGSVGVWTALIDRNQLENALLNLCLNARDAMPEGGRLTLETANKWMDERAARERDLTAGQYISICVTDTGTGMAPDVIERAFDPFFTTKPLGSGTGLGLSMVYGFARQSGGQVRIYSELGKGTTMCIYLPRHHGPEVATESPPPSAPAPLGRGQTVLGVDVEPDLREMIMERRSAGELMRAFAIVIGVLFAVLVLVAGVGAYWWHRNGQTVVASARTALSDGHRRGLAVDEAGCLAEALERYRGDRDGSMGEVVSRSLWLNGCLGSSRVAASFCEGVPPAREFLNLATWVTAACQQAGASGQGCQSLYQEVATYCSSPQRAAKAARPPT